MCTQTKTVRRKPRLPCAPKAHPPSPPSPPSPRLCATGAPPRLPCAPKTHPPRLVCAPKAQPIPAWGNAPGICGNEPRAESPIHAVRPSGIERAFSPRKHGKRFPRAWPWAGMATGLWPSIIAGTPSESYGTTGTTGAAAGAGARAGIGEEGAVSAATGFALFSRRKRSPSVESTMLVSPSRIFLYVSIVFTKP